MSKQPPALVASGACPLHSAAPSRPAVLTCAAPCSTRTEGPTHSVRGVLNMSLGVLMPQFSTALLLVMKPSPCTPTASKHTHQHTLCCKACQQQGPGPGFTGEQAQRSPLACPSTQVTPRHHGGVPFWQHICTTSHSPSACQGKPCHTGYTCCCSPGQGR